MLASHFHLRDSVSIYLKRGYWYFKSFDIYRQRAGGIISIQFISYISWTGTQQLEHSQLLQKHRLLEISLQVEGTHNHHICYLYLFAWCFSPFKKWNKICLPNGTWSLTGGGFKKVCSTDPPWAAASYLWCCRADVAWPLPKANEN